MSSDNKRWRRPPELLPERQDNTQAARVARRRAFRRQFDLAPEARGYVPAPYRNELPEAPEAGDDLTGQLLDVIEQHTNGERAGAASADPS
ncbi:hypothetical protein [Pseudonocardia sp. N23]|uniref:hypothetical protein n=1 Tax=Pseudonocardia sp. N23 TaxID=1987376 RepID=UPI000BFBB49C|nr:hypothetical protein [Pseudonocardia sp. N23]GAY12072.1 hypothetical protein TOK_0462 [Pseudonocardia sp. N23]